jgi:hypothetical protein
MTFLQRKTTCGIICFSKNNVSNALTNIYRYILGSVCSSIYVMHQETIYIIYDIEQLARAAARVDD